MENSFFCCKRCRDFASHGGKCLLAFLVSYVMGIAFPAAAQEPFHVDFNFENVRSGEGGRTDPTPVPEVTGLDFSPFRAVPAAGNPYGMSEHPSSKEVFSYKGWPVYDASDTATWRMDDTQYYEFSLLPWPGTEYRVDSITFKIARTATAPTHYALRSSLDGFSSNLRVVPVKEDENLSEGSRGEIIFADKESEYKRPLKSLLNVSTEEALVLRFYAWLGEKQNAPFKLDDVSVAGTVWKVGEETADSSEMEIATKRFPSDFMEVWQTSLAFRGNNGVKAFHSLLQLPRASFEAASAIANLNASQPLRLQGISLQVSDRDSVDVTSRFQVQHLLEEEIPPQSMGAELFRLAPRWRPTTPEEFVVKGTLRYTDPFDAQSVTAVLYPTAVSLPETAWFSTDCFVPAEGGMPVVFQVRNESAVTAGGVRMVKGEDERSDTLEMPPLPAGKTYRFVLAQVPDSLLMDGFLCVPVSDDFSPDTLLSPAPVLHRLVRMVMLYGNGHDELTDCLADGLQDGDLSVERIYGSEGEVIPMSWADNFRYDNPLLPARDSVSFFTVVQQNEGWNHARVSLPLSMQHRKVLSATRLSDSCRIPLYNAWTDMTGHFHLVDTAISEVERYRVCFTGLDLEPVVTMLTDSICLGDGYWNHGFELPPFTESGDYTFVDSLVAWSGADSIVVLRLNVCSKPSRPGAIIGDSVVVSAGNYLYTISPVPQAAVYLWSVFPSDWQLTGHGETVSLNVPYTGKGVLSVRAANRCGTSEPSSLNITSEPLGTDFENRLKTFVVYPDDNEGDFILETEGMEGKVTVAVSDLSGRVICSVEKELSDSDRTVRFGLNGTPSGMYIISIVNKNAAAAQKLQKE